MQILRMDLFQKYFSSGQIKMTSYSWRGDKYHRGTGTGKRITTYIYGYGKQCGAGITEILKNVFTVL